MLAAECLANGAGAGRRQLTALAQAKLAYVEEALEICARFRCRAFASVIPADAPRPSGMEFLRKDYAYLFERYFYFLEDTDREALGLVVFDDARVPHRSFPSRFSCTASLRPAFSWPIWSRTFSRGDGGSTGCGSLRGTSWRGWWIASACSAIAPFAQRTGTRSS